MPAPVLSPICELFLFYFSCVSSNDWILWNSSVSGLNFVINRHASTGRPSIVSMSLGGGASSSLDNAVASVSTISYTPSNSTPENSFTSSQAPEFTSRLPLVTPTLTLAAPLPQELLQQSQSVQAQSLMLVLPSPTTVPSSTSSLLDKMLSLLGLEVPPLLTTSLVPLWYVIFFFIYCSWADGLNTSNLGDTSYCWSYCLPHWSPG